MEDTLTSSEDSVLVLLDIQQRLVAAMPNDVGERLVAQVEILIAAAKALSVPIVVTEQYPQGLGSTDGVLKDALDDDATVIEKTSFSCVKSDEFCNILNRHGRKQIILTGMEIHICVLQTALDLQAQGFQVYVVENAVSSRSEFNKNNALQRLRQAGVIITTVESVMFEWLGDVKHPEFKMLAKLIK